MNHALPRLLFATGLSVCFVAGPATAGNFAFSPATSAGQAGGAANPDLFVQFTGDGATADWLADFSFNPSRLSIVATGLNGALCVVGGGNLVRVIAPLQPNPFPATAVNFCRLQIAVLSAAPSGNTPITPVPESISCVDANANAVTCTATGAIVSVGPATGSASVNYTPGTGSTIAIAGSGSSISAAFVPGGAGDSITITACTITGDPVFGPVTTNPNPLTFAGTVPATGSINLNCIAPSAGGSGLLTCSQSINGQSGAPRSWGLSCPNTFVPPSASYVPGAGSPVTVSSTNVVGEIDRAVIALAIGTDGVGTGPESTTSINNCVASNGFFASLQPPGGLSASGNSGASGQVEVSCVADFSAQSGMLTCVENRGGTVNSRGWPLTCPAGRPVEIFGSGFE